MAPISRREFVSLLGDLEQEDFSLFVAEVWRARGFDTNVEGSIVRARAADGEETVLWVRANSGWFSGSTGELPNDVDIVVSINSTTTEPEKGVRLIDGRELRDITLYAIDRSTADALCQQFLGRPISGPARERTHGIFPHKLTVAGDRVQLLAGGFAFLFLAAGLLLAPMLMDQPATPAASTPVPVSDRQNNSSNSTSSTAFQELSQEPNTPISIEPGALPPGLSRHGITDAEQMAETHAAQLTGRSYKLALTYREYNSNDRISVKHEEIRVENATTYSSDIVTASPLEFEPYLIADTESYANGTHLYIREFTKYGAEYRLTNIPYEWRTAGPIESRVERYLAWLLSVDDSSIQDVESEEGTQLFVLHSTGDSWPTPGTGSGLTVVDSRGLVHYVSRVYSMPGRTETRVMITIRYFDIDDTTVQPPSWYQDAVNATTRNTT